MSATEWYSFGHREGMRAKKTCSSTGAHHATSVGTRTATAAAILEEQVLGCRLVAALGCGAELCARLPKADLHQHLSGSYPLSSITAVLNKKQCVTVLVANS
jgi:hypothetical protein